MNQHVAHRLHAIGESCNVIGTGLATLLAGLIRLPFAIIIGWPDPNAAAMERQALLAAQLRDLEAKSEAAARAAAPKQ